MRKIVFLILVIVSHVSFASDFEKPVLTVEQVMEHAKNYLLTENRVSEAEYHLASFSFVYPSTNRDQPSWLIFYKRKDLKPRDFYLKISNELKPNIEFVGGE